MLGQIMCKIDKEKAILIAAEEAFMQKGFEGAKTTEIASRAGVTHAMLHYYFRTKMNLFNKVFESNIALLAESFMTSFANSSLSLTERIRLGVENHFDFLRLHPNLSRFILNEIIAHPERNEQAKDKICSIFSHISQNIEKEIKEAIKMNKIQPIRATDLILSIISLNAFVFISLPLYDNMILQSFSSIDDFLEARKKENVNLILHRIQKA
jgi:AcrR family transcriptional regulator